MVDERLNLHRRVAEDLPFHPHAVVVVVVCFCVPRNKFPRRTDKWGFGEESVTERVVGGKIK